MNTSNLPDVTVEDLLKIIGDKEVLLVRQALHIKMLGGKIEELCNTPLPEATPLKAATKKAS
jgi:hypothetical protein|tara:strand:- start:28 stop:213 length:186 start_codon:yes stop_codon:yes gene_type:complete